MTSRSKSLLQRDISNKSPMADKSMKAFSVLKKPDKYKECMNLLGKI